MATTPLDRVGSATWQRVFGWMNPPKSSEIPPVEMLRGAASKATIRSSPRHTMVRGALVRNEARSCCRFAAASISASAASRWSITA
ncbi:MAG: hypothetical protein IPJ41_06980 [Phycisphaerales bacterium]|nr:hypothetical protein [Phycisphaerales bacterium]